MLKYDADQGRTYINQNWAYQIKSLLESFGLSNLWLNQEYYTINLSKIKQRLISQNQKVGTVQLTIHKGSYYIVDKNIHLT